jgi:hypothetical protein
MKGESWAAGPRSRCAVMVVGGLLGLIGLFPGVAQAGEVTNVSVANGSPSSATGALTDYTVAFKTSSTGELSGTAPSKIMIALPLGTELEGWLRSSSATDTTTRQQVGDSCSAIMTTVTCTIYGTVAPENTVSVELDGVLNPGTADSGETAEVWTTSDPTHATSTPYTVTAAGEAVAPSVSDTTSAVGASSSYKVTFATSATGGLSGTAGSSITIVFPSETEIGSSSGTVTDTTTHQQVGVGYCSVSEVTVTCAISGNVAAGNTLAVELGHVVNPGSPNGDETVKVATSSDTTQVPSGGYAITAAREPGAATVTDGSPSSAAGALTDYTVAFKASGTGGMSGAAGSTITIVFPSGTELEGSVSGVVTDTTTRQQVGGGSCSAFVSAVTEVTCPVSGTVAPENTVSVELDRVVNPSSASSDEVAEVWTTSDTVHAMSSPYVVTAAGETAAATVSETTPAAGALTDYKVTFATSATGALSGTAGSRVAIVFPSGTELGGSVSGTVTDTTTHQSVGVGYCSVSEVTVTCAISGNVAAGNALAVELDHVVNPGSPNGDETVKVATSSDTTQVPSGGYGITAAREPGAATVTDGSPSSAAGALTDYTVTFKVSATGGLSGTAGSSITIEFPAGTEFGASVSGTVTDTTRRQQVGGGSCSVAVSAVTEVTCPLSGDVAAEDTVSVELDGVVNPSSADDEEAVEVWTTSDTVHAMSSPYVVTAPGETAAATVSDTTSAVGASASYAVTFTTSATGALSGTAGSRVTVTFPSGTELGESSGTVVDRTTHQPVGVGYCSVSEMTVACGISGNVAAGNTLAVELYRVVNPSSPNGDETVKVSTTSDTVEVPSNGYAITAAREPGAATVTDGSPSSAAGALTDYTVAFKTSSTGELSGAAGSTITIEFPSGTELEASVSGVVTDTTTRQQVGGGSCSVYVSAVTEVTCPVTGTVAPENTVSVELDHVVNPGTADGDETVEVWTTSDTAHARSNPYAVSPAGQTSQPTVVNSSPSSAPGALTDYAIAFTTSPTGGLSSKAGSHITIVLPPGTGLGSLSSSAVTDDSSGVQVGYCSPAGTTVTCEVYGTVTGGDAVSVELDGVVNPMVTAPETAKVSTTSDTVVAISAPYGVGAPVAVTGAASNVSQTAAFVAGTVDPEGTAVTDCHFEWGPSPSYGQSVACSQVVGSGASAEPVSAALTGLSPNATYHYRVVATNGGGTAYGADQTFATPAVVVSMSAPSVFPAVPAPVGSEGATFSGVVDPDGLATTVYFEYGLDPKYSGGGPVTYDQRTPAQAVGSDFAGHAVSASVSGLVPNAEYHVRMVVSNGAGTTVGADQAFTTGQSAAPPPPSVGRTVNMKPVAGLVLVKFPGRGPAQAAEAQASAAAAAHEASVAHEALTKGEGFVPLTETRQLPVGTEVDARQGTLELVAATGRGRRTNSAKLTGGLFTLSQQRAGLHKGLTTFTLNEGLFPGAPSYESCSVAAASRVGPRAQRAKLSSRVLQRLEASDDHGSFQTRGRYSAATVRGTSWSTADRCDGTFTHVRRGTVEVLDFATRKTTVLKAGQNFLAPAP